MLEGLWLKEEFENKPYYIFFFGLFFTVISVFVSKYLFPGQEGLVSVFLVSLMGAYPLIAYLRKREEKELVERLKEKKLLKRHWNELLIYLSFFSGVTMGYAISGFLFPSSLFGIQIEVISGIRSTISGHIFLDSLFHKIITNNIWVFALTFLISFLISAGMIFILVWNASVLGIFLATASENIYKMPMLMLSYLPHGILEISAYILAGISGALLSYQFDYYYIKKIHANEKALFRVLKDATVLVLIGLVCLFMAGFMEVL